MILAAIWSVIFFTNGGLEVLIWPLVLLFLLPLAVPLVVSIVATFRRRKNRFVSRKDFKVLLVSLLFAAPFIVPFAYIPGGSVSVLIPCFFILSISTCIALARLFSRNPYAGDEEVNVGVVNFWVSTFVLYGVIVLTNTLTDGSKSQFLR